MLESVACYLRGRRDRLILAPACTTVGLVERVLISDRRVRAARISGQVVTYFSEPASIVPRRAEAA
jgi:hypothetical protein